MPVDKTSPHRLVEQSQDIDTLVRNYEHALITVVTESDLALSGLGRWTEAFHSSGLSLQRFLKEHEERVRGTLSDTTRVTGELIDMVPEVLHGLPDFSRADRSVYADVHNNLGIYSAKSELNRKAQDPRIHRAISAALDRWVLQEARDSIGIYTAKSELRYASGEPARQAMDAALDRRVVDEAKQSIGVYSAKSELKYATPNITEQLARQILIETFPDEMVNDALRTAREEFLRMYRIPAFVDLENPPTEARLRETDDLINNYEAELSSLGKLSFIRRAKLERDISTLRSYREHMREGLEWVQANRHIIEQWKNIENNIKSGGDRQRGAQDRRNAPRRPHRTPPQEGRKIPLNEQIYLESIEKLAMTDRSLGQTLSSYPKKSVLKVINTVTLARQKAVEKGEPITDREILIRYMRISNTNPEATPEQIEATQIMLTLMGNKVSGKLPF